MPPEATGEDLLTTPSCGSENPLAFLEDALAGMRRFQAFVTASDLGIFRICTAPATVDDIAAGTGCRPDLTGILCECLVSLGLLERGDGGAFTDTAFTREFLGDGAPFPQESSLQYLREMAGLWMRLPDVLKGGPVVFPREERFSRTIIPSMAETARCGLLQRVTSMVAALPEFPRARRLLDLGGGHGLYAIAFTRRNPDLEAVVFDLPQVTQRTEEYIRGYDADRVSTRPGDFFTDSLGEGYDIIFSSSNPGGKIPALIPKIHGALREGGLYVNKQSLDGGGRDPFTDMEWNLWTFQGMEKQAGRYRFRGSVPLEEYNRVLGDSGFTLRQVIPVDSQSVMTVAEKVAGEEGGCTSIPPR